MSEVIVRPASGRLETLVVAGVVASVVLSAGVAVANRRVDEAPQRLFDWQISAFHDLNEIDQAVYNALSVASGDLWWFHGRMLYAGTEAEKADPWPTVDQLHADFVPPFVRDPIWEQQGRVAWERVASFSFEGSAVYFGSGGTAPGQSAYLLQLSHVHKGASYRDGATVWVHPDPNAPRPETVTRDSLIVNGWKEVVPYSGAMEVDRLRRGPA